MAYKDKDETLAAMKEAMRRAARAVAMHLCSLRNLDELRSAEEAQKHMQTISASFIAQIDSEAKRIGLRLDKPQDAAQQSIPLWED